MAEKIFSGTTDDFYNLAVSVRDDNQTFDFDQAVFDKIELTNGRVHIAWIDLYGIEYASLDAIRRPDNTAQLVYRYSGNPQSIPNKFVVGIDQLESAMDLQGWIKSEMKVEPESHKDNASFLQPYKPEERKLIDEACIGWASRGYLGLKMDEFLSQFFRDHDIFLSKDQFKKALKDAAARKLIIKDGRFWRVP